MKVVVTGGGGRTGRLVVKKLSQRKEFDVVATVRSEQAKADLSSSLSLPASKVAVWDIASSSAVPEELQGAYGMVVITSAVPEMVPPAPGAPPGPPTFVFKGGEDGIPEKVDWLGQKTQIDSAKAAGVKHVVIVGSMGGTDPNHMLNKIGNANILQWKRRAEQYLMQSGLMYTIIHPGGLLDEEGGQRQLLLGVDDELSTKLHGSADKPFRTIPRADVAELCIQSLLLPEAQNRAFDATSMPPGEGTPTTDFAALIASLEGKNCDYSLNSQWP